MDHLEGTMEEKQSTTIKPMTDFDKLLEKHFKRPPSLWNVMRHQLGFSIDMCDEIVDAVEEWMPKEHDTNSYEWNKCVRMLRERLWDQPE
jgi:hypothetical protein